LAVVTKTKNILSCLKVQFSSVSISHTVGANTVYGPDPVKFQLNN